MIHFFNQLTFPSFSTPDFYHKNVSLLCCKLVVLLPFSVNPHTWADLFYADWNNSTHSWFTKTNTFTQHLFFHRHTTDLSLAEFHPDGKNCQPHLWLPSVFLVPFVKVFEAATCHSVTGRHGADDEFKDGWKFHNLPSSAVLSIWMSHLNIRFFFYCSSWEWSLKANKDASAVWLWVSHRSLIISGAF